MTKQTKNFILNEFLRSDTAERIGLDNRISDPEILDNIRHFATHLLQPVRNLTHHPVYIISGYRSVRLNEALGRSKGSLHCLGQAADIHLGSRELNRELFQLICNSQLPVDQVIAVKDFSRIHLSLKKQGNRQEFLTTHDGDTYTPWPPTP